MFSYEFSSVLETTFFVKKIPPVFPVITYITPMKKFINNDDIV